MMSVNKNNATNDGKTKPRFVQLTVKIFTVGLLAFALIGGGLSSTALAGPAKEVLPHKPIPKPPPLIGVSPDVDYRIMKIAHDGVITTDLSFSELFQGNATLTAWVMPEFVYSKPGAIFGTANGDFFVGQEDYRKGNGGPNKIGPYVGTDPVLVVRIGNKVARYLASGFERRKWHHLALVRFFSPWTKSFNYYLYLNGQQLTPFKRLLDESKSVKDEDGNIKKSYYYFELGQNVATNYVPPGTLQFGYTDMAPGEGDQWYGLLDDVMTYSKAFTPTQVEAVMQETHNSETAWSLIAGWTFDTYSNGWVHPNLTRPITKNHRVFRIPVHQPRMSASADLFDSPWYISPSETIRHLPFTPGQIWYVIQAPDTPTSTHNGYATFSWDFGRMHLNGQGQWKRNSKFEIVYAAAKGDVVNIGRAYLDPKKDENDTDWDHTVTEEKVHLRSHPNEQELYMHMEPYSYSELSPYGFIPEVDYPFTWHSIEEGAPVARVDEDRDHLHYGVSHVNTPRLGPGGMPIAFHNYEVLENCEKTLVGSNVDNLPWKRLIFGMPQNGECVRHFN